MEPGVAWGYSSPKVFYPGNAMSQTTQALESAALLLPPEERARLAERLLASLDIDPEIEEAWAAEVEKRLADWEAGLVKEHTLDEVREHVRARLSTK